jgi:uncharacterized protein YdaU (DUF1376 family)
MSKTDHWMPLYVGDFLADTMHLSASESGAYLLLLMHYWRAGPLPDDDRKLAGIARCPPREWRKVSPLVRAFFTSENNQLHQKRMDIERARHANVLEAKRRGGKARWDKETSSTPDAEPPPSTSIAHPDAEHVLSTDVCDAKLRTQPQPDKERKIPPTADASASIWPDARAELWGEGLPILRGLTGKPDGPSRGLLGKLLKAARDDCPSVMRVLREAADLRPAEPVAWLTAALRQPDDDTRLMIAAGLLPSRNGHDLDGEATELFPRMIQ